MWAAANRKRSRTDAAGNLSESDYDSDTSSDGERSTTESIHENVDDNAPPSTTQTQVRKKLKRKRKKKATRENPEATMARLTSSYSAAMSAVGALHRLSRQYSKQHTQDEKPKSGNNAEDNIQNDQHKNKNEGGNNTPEITNDIDSLQKAHSSIQRVAHAARNAFEQSLLLDHVILAPILLEDRHSKTLSSSSGARTREKDTHFVNESMSCTSSAWFNTWNCDLESKSISMVQWKRLNAAHRNSTKKLSYLTLVNYADLLLCGCDCHRSSLLVNDGKGQDTLDKGAVTRLGVLELFQQLEGCSAKDRKDNGHSNCCLWRDETRERTLRLAVAAYCDASDLDSTDPTLWLKLACAARALGRETDSNSALPSKSFRFLERLALERGLSSLPKGVPPNRMLLRAWREVQARERRIEADSEGLLELVATPEEDGLVERVLELPKYSWSTLGFTLLEASSCLPDEEDFGSPQIGIRIPPLLSCPPKILKRISGWLGRDDVNRMILTCSSVAQVLKSTNTNTQEPKTLPSCNNVSDDKDQSQILDSQKETTIVGSDASNNSETNSSGKDGEPNTVHGVASPRRGRVSKRVQSQAITSEKQTERRAKRSSAEYCLLAGVLSSTAQNPIYRKLIEADVAWDKLPIFKRDTLQMQAMPPVQSVDTPQCASVAPVQHLDDFIASSSLSTFIQSMSRANSGPIDVLDKFLVHLSLHTKDIFGCENTDDLSACVIECFDKLSGATKSYSELVSPWYGDEEFDEENLSIERALQVASVNLLVAELRFKKCECNESGDLSSNDGIKLDFVIPNLLHCISILSQYDASDDQVAIILELKCRYYWLASTYYTWLGHRCNDISVSKDADMLSLEYLDVCLECLSEFQQLGSEQSIKTPHLGSDHRHENHWVSLSVDVLVGYKQYLLSTAVVSKVRQDFYTISCQLKEGLPTDIESLSITEDQKIELSSLGAELVNRYKPQSNEKTEELFNDFILTHGEHLALKNNDESVANHWDISVSISNGKDEWGNVWSAIPSTKIESIEQISSTQLLSPSILQVLCCSLLLSEGDTQPLLSIYSQLISLALKSRTRILQSSTEDRMDKSNLMLLASKYFADKLADKMSEASTEVHHELGDDFDEQTLINAIQLFQNTISVEPKEQIKEANAQSHQNLAGHELFHSASRLVFAVQQCQGLSTEIKRNVESIYFVGLVKAFVQGKIEFASLITSVSDKRLKTWQIELNNKASKICFIANELAELLSKTTTCIDVEGNARVSHLVKGLVCIGNESIDVAPLAQFSESLLWFWKFLNNRIDATSPSENAVKDRLLVSVCATMIALCGSPGVSVVFAQSISERKYYPTNSDYFDSDNSVNGVFMLDVSAESELQHSKRTLTRQYCQLTQCVSLVFEFSETAASRIGLYPSSQHGPFLSLVTVRTLSNMADEIFTLFSEDIWSEEWPYGARECGSTLDSVLSKAYSSIYGFSLTSQAQSNDLSKSYAPESIMAAAQLFRSVKRVYNKHSRRSPPTKAFETMEMALPSAEENAVSKAITGYMFDSDKDIDAVRFSTVDTPPDFPEWVFYEAQNAIGKSIDDESSCVEILRRGICRELAKCPISHIGSDEPEEGHEGLSEERESTQRYELSLGRKFRAVLDDLSYDPRNIENWIVLSECLGFKADIICDRLVRDKDPYDTSDFCPPMQPTKSKVARSLDELREIQSSEYTHRKWHPFIGKDLSVYIQYPWSNLNSLRDCSKDVKSSLSLVSESVNNTEVDLQIWREIETIFENGEYSAWANAWAGMFVAALRTMRMKALRVARYLAKKKLGKMHPSEVNEDIGTALYGDLMASTVYGFPMQQMCNYEKRSIAEGAQYYFEEAIESSKSVDYACDSKTESWEVQFMIGKCCEKIASTLCEEIYQSDVSQTKRRYETKLIEAIQHYSAALGDAQQVEKAGGGQDNKSGGSSHGSREVLYRLHATRFKALLSAIRQAADERGLAELEACRISSTSWFDDSNKLQTSDDDVRHNIWDLYVDCIHGLSSCRKGISYFHRATYRLAQALHWAPAFHDPCFCFRTGSIENIPMSKKERISELDKKSFAECAASVIGTLFDKKRSHLAAVWVTTSAAPPPYEVLNDSVRKYDALRLKYIMAFIDTMVLCKQRDKIETFLSWAVSSSQDIPGFYEASAKTFQGGNIERSLLSGSGFLTKVQRAALTALAKMILQDLTAMKKDGMNEQARKLLKDDFKLSHILFLRLRSTPEEIVRAANSNQSLDEVVVAFCRCYLSIQSGRINDSINLNGSIDNVMMLSSLLDGASEKAKEMFPVKKNKLKTLKRQAEDAGVVACCKGKGLSSSDDFHSPSESSSSLSKRQQKKSYFPSKLFRKTSNTHTDDVGGYESESDASTNSTRSTSSSFLRYQNKFLKLKSVFEKRGDGSEIPLQSKSKLPTIFDRIYRRQNTVDDNYASDESEEDTSAPSEIICEEIICSELVDDTSTLFLDNTSTTNKENETTAGEGQNTPTEEQTSSKVQYPTQQLSQTLPETAVATDEQKQGVNTKPSRSQQKKKRTKKTAKLLLAPVPVSIPRTISYSLRSAISDGSRRERNSHTLMKRRALRVNGSHIDTSYWSHRGKRAYMEDRYVIEYMGTTSKDPKQAQPITLLGVFDGHGGAEASQFCSDWLSSYIRKDKEYPSNIPAAMKSAFTTVDKDFVSSGFLDGSTACACSIIGSQKIICCNAGDSRAIIVKKNGSFIPLSEDHKPDRSDETTRINELGGRVIHWGRWRVEGVLAVSRSIGDARLKPYVTAEPDVVEHIIQDDDMFLVIASDGVWDTMSSDLVAKFTIVNTCKIVNKDLEVDESLFRWIARQISKRARENGSSDNTSVIVANLRK